MTILFDARRVVKSDNFGRGILRSLPTVRVPYTVADDAWLVEDNARREAREIARNARLERIYEAAQAVDRIANGHIL